MSLFGKKKKLYKVLIRDPFGDREELWKLSKEEANKSVDEGGIAYAIVYYEGGQPNTFLVPKDLWEKFDDVANITGNPELSQEEQEQQILKLIKGQSQN